MDTAASKETRQRSTSARDNPTKPQLQRLLAGLSERSVNSAESSRDFHVRAVNWLIVMRSHNHDDLRLECLEACAKYFYRNADGRMVLEVVTQIDRIASTSRSQNWNRKAQSYLGIAYADMGDLYQSLVCYGKALHLARANGNRFDESIVLSNMGTALMAAGLYTDSMCAFELAFNIGMSDSALVWTACCAATNMAQISVRQGRHEAGIRHLCTALGLEPGFPPEQYDLHRVILEQIYVQLAIGVGDAYLARQRLRFCEEFALRAQSLRAKLIA